MAYVYGHYKADTGELFYIGKGSGKRAWATKGTGRNPYWQNVVAKHGFVVKILEDGLTHELAYEREKQMIAEVGLDNLVNMTSGGDGHTSEEAKRIASNPEFKKKQSEIWKQKWQDPEYRARLSNIQKEVSSKLWQDPEYKQAHLDKIQSVENREKIAEASRKMWADDEFKEGMRQKLIERWQTPEHKKKVSEGLKRSWAERKLNKGKSINE